MYILLGYDKITQISESDTQSKMRGICIRGGKSTLKKSQVIKAFKKIAEKEGVTVEEVREEIQKAIDAAMQSDDPAVKLYWKNICNHGKTPTPEEVVIYISEQVKAYEQK